jgi:hypothetical protein
MVKNTTTRNRIKSEMALGGSTISPGRAAEEPKGETAAASLGPRG